MEAERSTGEGSASDDGRNEAGVTGRSFAGDAPWLLAHKVELPDPVLGYVERPELEAKCLPAKRRLTVLHAPGGFGKTALLARCCHRLRDDGVAVAWLSVDEKDGPMSVASYITLAFEQAGVNVFDRAPDTAEPAVADATGDAADSPADYRINLLMHAIRRFGEPCVLALDELDRLQCPEAVAVLNAVLHRAPRNLGFAMAFRERPPGLDVAMFALEGRGETLTAEDLRFSTRQIARFFEPRLSRAQLASVASESAGWPIALRLYRNALKAGTPISELVASDTVAAWIESRLWRGLSAENREFVLDICLFDWIDARLIDEVTGRSQSGRRLDAMVSLRGLLQTAGGGRSAMRLHPLIRDYGSTRLFRDNRPRFESIHAGIARTLARRGHILDALRHAAEAGDSGLVGAIAEQAGGVKLWLRRGTDALRALDGCLTEDVLAAHPRLALVRCIALAASGDMDGARRVYQGAAMKSVGFTRDAGGEEDEALQADHLVVLGMFAILGCSLLPRYDTLIEAAGRLARQPDLDPLLRGMVNIGLSMTCNEKAHFDEAVQHAESASADLAPTALYVLPQIEFQLGTAAMARGKTDEAQRRYEHGLNIAQSHVGDTGTVMTGGVLSAELELERCASAPLPGMTPVSARLLGEYGVWFDVYAAGLGVAAELAWYHGSRETALAGIEQAREFARATDRAALARLLSAQRVSLLVIDGRTDEAAQAWRAQRMPTSAEACLDLKTQRWREVEAIACARLRLMTAQGDAENARSLASALRDLASKRALIRTLMRALALSARLESEAGNPERAAGHVVEALHLYRHADYARPLAREKAVVIPLLQQVIDADKPASAARTARALRASLTARNDRSQAPDSALLSRKELDVLRRLCSRADREIAEELGMSYDAVRYYVRKIFARVGARNRFDAVHRARGMGLLPSDEADRLLDR